MKKTGHQSLNGIGATNSCRWISFEASCRNARQENDTELAQYPKP
jgi:hypothetical protein